MSTRESVDYFKTTHLSGRTIRIRLVAVLNGHFSVISRISEDNAADSTGFLSSCGLSAQNSKTKKPIWGTDP
jgi:hypothetical protein